LGGLGTTLGFGAVALRSTRRAGKVKVAAFDASKEVGVTAPLGYFDPLGFSKGKDEAYFFQLRSAEIKHGRVAMMASIGLVFQHFIHLPSLASVPSGAFATTDLNAAPYSLALLAASAAGELWAWKQDPKLEPGNFGDPSNLLGSGIGAEYSVDWRNKELNNGRMAMISVLGEIVAELVTGKDAFQQFG